MSKKLGFIGCGNMGKAMIHGVLASARHRQAIFLHLQRPKAPEKRMQQSLESG